MPDKFTCVVSHEHWSRPQTQVVTLEKRLQIGRDPGASGIKIGNEDHFVSAVAVKLQRRKDGVEILNSSSHSEIDVQHANAVRHLFPGEGMVVNSSVTVLVPSRDYVYPVVVQIEGSIDLAKQTTGTRSLFSQKLELAEERIPALAGLCASFLLPNHFGSAPLKASEISELLAKNGLILTPKAINHKIQRTREQVEEFSGLYIDDREGLAQFLIKNKMITVDHVRMFLLNSSKSN